MTTHAERRSEETEGAEVRPEARPVDLLTEVLERVAQDATQEPMAYFRQAEVPKGGE